MFVTTLVGAGVATSVKEDDADAASIGRNGLSPLGRRVREAVAVVLHAARQRPVPLVALDDVEELRLRRRVDRVEDERRARGAKRRVDVARRGPRARHRVRDALVDRRLDRRIALF